MGAFLISCSITSLMTSLIWHLLVKAEIRLSSISFVASECVWGLLSNADSESAIYDTAGEATWRAHNRCRECGYHLKF